MSFEEKLKALRNAAEREKELEKVCIEEEARVREVRRRRKRQELERLEELARERLQPLLETVNGIYANGKGVIELRRLDYGRSQEPDYEDPDEPRMGVSLELGWDYWRGSRSYGGKQVRLLLEQPGLTERQTITIKGYWYYTSPVTKIELDHERWGENWKQQVEDGIYQVLSKGTHIYKEEEPHCGW